MQHGRCRSVVPASPPIVVATPAGQVNVSFPACFSRNTSSGYSSWLAYVESLPSVTHIWAGFDAAGCNSLADSVGSGATALPSPVPLASPTTQPTPPGAATCGAPGISNDGNTSVNFAGTTSGGNYFTVPSGALPGLAASWSVCAAVKAAPYGQSDSNAIVWGYESSSTSQSLNYFKGGAGLVQNYNGANGSTLYDSGNAAEYQCMTVTSGSTAQLFYVNGTITYTSAATLINAANGMQFGNYQPFENYPFFGRMCCMLLANTVLTQAQIQTMTTALGY